MKELTRTEQNSIKTIVESLWNNDEFMSVVSVDYSEEHDKFMLRLDYRSNSVIAVFDPTNGNVYVPDDWGDDRIEEATFDDIDKFNWVCSNKKRVYVTLENDLTTELS